MFFLALIIAPGISVCKVHFYLNGMKRVEKQWGKLCKSHKCLCPAI